MKKGNLLSFSNAVTQQCFRLLLLIIVFFGFVSSAYSNGAATGYVGAIMQINGGAKTSYMVNSNWNNDSFCNFYKLSSATTFSGTNFGHVTALALNGLVIDGWTDNTDWISGQVEYRIWLQSGSRPGSATGTFNVGGYGTDCSVSNVQCTSVNNRRVGWDASSVNVLGGLTPGIYNFEIISHGQLRYSCGSWGQVDNAAVTATFTVDPVVTFNSNSGSGTMSNQTVSYNTSTALTANLFTRTSYTFNGWNTAANGSGTSYANIASVTLTASTTLYAQWLAAAVPIITGVTSSLPASSTTQTYKGATITVTGTTLGSVTTVKLGGSGGTAISGATIASTSITFTVPDGTSGGTVYVSDGINTYTSSATFSNLGYISNAATDWNIASTWLGGEVPAASSNLTIAHAITLNAAATNTTFNNVTIASSGITFGASGAVTVAGTLNNGGSIVMTSGGTLTMGAASTLANGSATFTAGIGTVSFTGAGTVTGTIAFNNLTVNGAVTLSTTTTVNGNLQLNSGSSIVTNAPIYGASSTLIYNTTGSYGTGTEWTGNSATAGSGVPKNVTIQNSTTVTLPTSNRGMAGALNISSGTLALNATSGDLYIAGNWTNSGTFTPNNRAVFFNGSADQTVTKSGGETFDWFIVDKSGGSLLLGSNITINSSKNVTFTNGTITLGNYNFQLNSGTAIVTPTSAKYFISNGTGYLIQNVSSSEVTFPVGTSTVYAPAFLTQAGTAENLSVRVASAITNAPAGDTNALVNLQWTLNESTAGSNNITTKFQWNTAQEGSSFSRTGSVQIGRYLSSSYTTATATEAGANPYTASAANMTSTISGTQFVVGNNTAFAAVPSITAISSSLPAFSSTQTYKGATVTVTGTNLSAITAIKLGGVTGTSITTSSPTQIGNATSLNFVVPDGTSGGTIYVSDGTNSATSSGSLTNLGFISSNSSNWSVGSTWLGGTVPTTTDNVSIAHGTSVMLDGDKTVANFTINSTTGNFSNSTYTLTITANGTLTNNNSGNGFTRNSGTVSFAGTGTIVGTIGFNNVTIAGGVNFGSASTINGILQINAGGYVNTNAPTYASGSTLKYYSATTYGRGTEWSTTTGAGYPYHVQISNNTTLDMGANSGTATARQCAGNLTVDAGSTFSMNATAMSAAVTVIGNVVNNGTITLSGTSGGDLKTQGNINDSGTFNANNRAIFFNGGNTQVIQGTGVFDISYVRINKTGGSVQLATDLTCAGPTGGNAMEIDGTSSILDLNGHTLYLGQASTASTYNSGIATPGSIKGSTSSNISILGTGALGTLNFTSGSQTLNNLSIDRQTSGTVSLGSVLTVNGQLSLTNGTLSNSTNLTLGNGATVVRSVGTLAAVPTFGSSVNLTYSGSATKGNEFPATDIINTLTANNTAGITLADNRNIPNLSIGTGSSLTVNAGKQLTVSTTMSNSGTLNLLSTSADGTATIITPTTITNSSSTYHVYQYLSGARNWYVSSPVSTATASANYTYYVRNEGANSWPVVTTGTALAAGTGYIANLATGTSTIDFTGGTLNSNATIPVTLIRHAGVTKEGFNLVGNPYPAHITLTKTITDAANALNTIWYRTATWDGSKYIYAFSTCLMNQDGSILSTPFGTSTNIVAPMQAFWVRANAGGGTLTFASTMRSHESSNPIKAPAKMNVTQQILRLQVTNSSLVSDEAVVYFNSNASNEFDSYDSPKMANLISSFPEIYTLSSSSTEQLAINGLNSVPYDVELPIGFTTGETNTFTIKASEFSNFDSGVKVYLVDKLLNKETELTASDYTFNSDIASSTTRFSLIFKAPSVATGNNSNTDNSDMLVYKNMNNQITVKCGGALNSESTVAVYNGVGQRLVSEKLKSNITLLANRLSSGVYMVTVTNGSKMLTKKLVVD